VAEWLVAQKVDVVLAKASLHGKGPVYVFRDAGIELRQAEADTLAEVVQGLQKLGGHPTEKTDRAENL
jgi:predicted Fe-Mo cluster-binding NifX family protein